MTPSVASISCQTLVVCLQAHRSNMVWRTMGITIGTCFLLGKSGTTLPLSLMMGDPPSPTRCVYGGHPTDIAGTTFTHWIADHNVLWRSPLTPEALFSSITYYSLLSAAPVGLAWAYVAIGLSLLGFAGGRLVKGVKSGDGEILFDGGSVGASASWAQGTQEGRADPTSADGGDCVQSNIRSLSQ